MVLIFFNLIPLSKQQTVLLPSIILLEDDLMKVWYCGAIVLLPSIILLEDDWEAVPLSIFKVLLPSIILLEDDLRIK